MSQAVSISSRRREHARVEEEKAFARTGVDVVRKSRE